MSTTYHPFKIVLTDGQKKKLQKAYVTKTPVNLKLNQTKLGVVTNFFSLILKSRDLRKPQRQGKEW